MSKEQLEEIIEIDREISNGFAIEDLDLNTMTVVNRGHFEWLIEQAEQVQKLEEILDQDKRHEENRRYRDVLERISKHDAYEIDIFVAGKMADRALEGDPHESS